MGIGERGLLRRTHAARFESWFTGPRLRNNIETHNRNGFSFSWPRVSLEYHFSLLPAKAV